MRSIRALLWLCPLLAAGGCGPSDIDEAGRSFTQFAHQWSAREFPGEPVLKETTNDVAIGDDSNYQTQKGYYRRRTTFEGLRFRVVGADRGDIRYLGILEGERVVQSTPVHPTAEEARQDTSFRGARFAYPERYEFEYARGGWRLRQ